MNNILLIENNDQIIMQITSALKKSNYSLEIAECVEKGYNIAIKKLPNLIICSKNVLQTDSSETLFRDNNSFILNTPIIYLIDGETKINRVSSNPGVDYYIRKPFKDPELLKLITFSIEKSESVKKQTEQKLNELRGSISFSLPHEFFTPLNGIIGFSDILVKEIDLLSRAETVEMLKYIHKDAIRLKKLTENFLAFAQLEMISVDNEKKELLKKCYYLNPVEAISSVSKVCAHTYEREDDLVLEVSDAIIRISESYLKKVITEIIDNAFKFSLKGTPVIVTILSNDTSVLISVSDSGIGMSPEQISSIGAYMQFNRKMHEQQGSGLGLIISKKIVELHNGEFTIESSLHDGTKINILFDN